MHAAISWLGGLLSGDQSAYIYLPNSAENFLTAETLAECMSATSFKGIGFQRRM